ncbi:hypothetical protein [Brachybacterium sp. UNK5269]|uniref:hypothetical protein n=1 Tax=Brachybacterium sp. UNK5269 TaxID=3408576 RepID=UPI003BAF6B64
MSEPIPRPEPVDDQAVLFVRTLRIDEAVDLPGHIPSQVSGAWLRHGQGIVALGSAWSARTAGPDRFAAASTAFQALADRALVDDEVRVRTSGLIALGSFSYADASARASTLMVPRAVLGVHDGEAFLTVVGVDQEPTPPTSWRDLFPSSPVAAARPPHSTSRPTTRPTSTRPWSSRPWTRSARAGPRRWCSPSAPRSAPPPASTRR